MTPSLDETRRHSLDHGLDLGAHARHVLGAAAVLGGAGDEAFEGALGEFALEVGEGGGEDGGGEDGGGEEEDDLDKELHFRCMVFLWRKRRL